MRTVEVCARTWCDRFTPPLIGRFYVAHLNPRVLFADPWAVSELGQGSKKLSKQKLPKNSKMNGHRSAW